MSIVKKKRVSTFSRTGELHEIARCVEAVFRIGVREGFLPDEGAERECSTVAVRLMGDLLDADVDEIREAMDWLAVQALAEADRGNALGFRFDWPIPMEEIEEALGNRTVDSGPLYQQLRDKMNERLCSLEASGEITLAA